MNAAEIIRRINRELKDWDGEGPEVSWTKNGLNRALHIVRTLAKVERIRALERRPRISRWLAGELYSAIRLALGCLARGERSKAIDILTHAKASADQQRKVPADGAS